MLDSIRKEAEALADEISKIPASKLQEASDEMLPTFKLREIYAGTDDEINEAMRVFFVESNCSILSDDEISNKRAPIQALKSKIDFRKSPHDNSASWYIHKDELDKLKYLVNLDEFIERLVEWPDSRAVYESLRDKYNKHTPGFTTFTKHLQNKLSSLKEEYEAEGLPSRQITMKLDEFSFRYKQVQYLSPQAQEDATKWTKSLHRKGTEIERLITNGCKTVKILATEYDISPKSVVHIIKQIRADAVERGDKPSTYAHRKLGPKGKIWIVTPLGLFGVDGEKPVQGVETILKDRISQRAEYEMLLGQDGTRTTQMAATDTKKATYNIIKYIYKIREQAIESDKNPDDYARIFDKLESKPWLITKIGFEGDEYVSGIKAIASPPTQETSQHPPSAAASSPTSSAPEVHRASPPK